MNQIKLIVLASAACVASAAAQAADPPFQIGYCTWYLDFAIKIGGQTSAQMQALADQWLNVPFHSADPNDPINIKRDDGLVQAGHDFGGCLKALDRAQCVRETAKAPGIRERVAPCAKGPTP